MKERSQSKVAVVMGSTSDRDQIEAALDALETFGIPYDVRVLSAHRTPKSVQAFAKDADRHYRLVIAAAGMAAHLAGAIASMTTLPVIGVPMASGPLQGVDALLSTVQMPRGVPVATVAIGASGAFNAGVLAAEILALGDSAIRERLSTYRQKRARELRARSRSVEREIQRKRAAAGDS